MVAVTWAARSRPREVRAVAAWGDAARALARRLLRETDESLGQWEGICGTDLLIVMGPELPWVEGLCYLGRDAGAPDLLLPTFLEPSVSTVLLQRAVEARFPALGPPLVILPVIGKVASAAGARAIDRAKLSDWVKRP